MVNNSNNILGELHLALHFRIWIKVSQKKGSGASYSEEDEPPLLEGKTQL